MKISIVLITYNHEKYISKAIESILLQRELPGDFEIIVCDDHSTDNTIEIAKEFFQELPNVNIFSNEQNLGITKNYQQSFSRCKGEYIFVLEGDDYWTDPSKIKKITAFLDEHPECVMCSHLYFTLKDELNNITLPAISNQEDINIHDCKDIILDPFIGNNFSTCCYRNAEIQKISAETYNTISYEWMINISITQFGFCAVINKPMSVYRVSSSGSWSKLTEQEQLKGIINILPEYDTILEKKYRDHFEKKTELLKKQLHDIEERQVIKSQIPEILNTNHYPSLDGMRTICISLVLFAHLCDAYKFNEVTRNFITQIGLLGVQIFFVISGFLITTLLLKEKITTGNISLKNFYIRRVFRILPVAFLYLLCLLFLNFIFHLHVPLKCFIGAAFFLANLNSFKGSWYTAHYWSLSVEEQYYLVFPLLLKTCKFKTHFVILFFLLLIIFVKETAYLQLSIFPDYAFLNTIASLLFQSDGVLIGSLLSIVWFKNYIPLQFLKRYNTFLLLLLPVLIVIFFTNVITLHAFNTMISSLLIAIFLVCTIVNRHTFFYKFLNNKYITIIGKLSFSIYIWQQIFTSTEGKFGSLARLPLNLLLLAIVSYCSYYFYEKKFLKMKCRFKVV